MFDRIRRAIICLTTSDDAEKRNKLDEVNLRRVMIEAEAFERRAIRDDMRARLELLHEWIREYDNIEKYLKDHRRKQKEERKRAAKAQAAQEKNSSESFPYVLFNMVPANQRRLVGGQASIDPGN
ncbi:hypothetical protein FVER53590_12419 [Fusarium verticillioides]|nr:hypothetical protein FVER14953_12419 [Fusarium verticillioides]RBR10316.1 hypothetical protein FVER53590_12419 [Fusarium verticillioides]